MHMKHGARFVTCTRKGGEVSSSREREPPQEMDLCWMMHVSLNAKVHGIIIIMMLSLMKPGKKFDTISGTFAFHL